MSSGADLDNVIASLKHKNRRLSDELKDKNKLLNHFMDIAQKQSQQISFMNAALDDTAVWDPLTCPRPSSCSTPTPAPVNGTSWVDVVVRGNHRRTPEEPAAPGPVLSNRFAALTYGGATETPTAPPAGSLCGRSPCPRPSGTIPSGGGTSAPVGLLRRHSPPYRSEGNELRETTNTNARRERVSVHSTVTSSSRRRLLRDAVRGHSAGSLRCNSVVSPTLTAGGSLRHNTAGSPPAFTDTLAAAVPSQQGPSPALPRSVSAASYCGGPQRAAAAAATAATTATPQPSTPAPPHSSSPPPPRPLFAPTALLVGDSIIRHCKFFNATTHCFPGATVRTILDNLPTLLQSAPPTINKIIVHVGTNDITRRQSEKTKSDFKDLFEFLAVSGKTVFISSPIPTFGRGDERFSRIRELHTWLKHITSSFNFGFIDNFNLFWCRSTFYQPDGIHINTLGNRFLTANILYTVHSHNQY